MEPPQKKRAQQTRERIHSAARQLFLQQGYLATSTDAILAQAGISSKETLYRYYASKEALFVDVLGQMTLAQPGFSALLSSLPVPLDLPSLRQALTMLAHEILSIMSQPEYLALVRIIVAESARFPQLGSLFLSTVPQHGLSIIIALLHQAHERQVIAAVNFEAVARMLLSSLLTYAVTDLMSANKEVVPPSLDHADEVVEVIMRALKP